MRLPDPEHWAQLSPLLDELLDLSSPEAQMARLADLQASDPALADELDALLQADCSAKASGLLSGHAALPPLGETSLAGQRIGAYRLEALIGEGGSGAVWRAHRDDGQYEGRVAIKLLHLSSAGRAAAQRFRREGAILARLTHPNIARMLDAGVTPDGQPYLVLELVDGDRIDSYADAQRLNVEQRISLFAQVLAALTHAHSHLVIHRDIKPGNILVGRDGTVKLLDFGIAKLLEEHTDTGATGELTRDGARALTPEFAAPEQLSGEPVTTATDVYALGVVLYQLLAGRHPTALERATAAQFIVATIETDPTLLSRAVEKAEPQDAARIAAERATTPQRLVRLLRGDLSNIVARCLRKQPAQRYLTTAALSEDLRRYLAHEPVSARADSLRYRTGKFARKHRAAVVAAGLTTLALVAATGVATWQMLEARQQREEVKAQAARAEASANFLNLMVTEIGADGGTPTPRQMLDRGLYLLDHSEGADPKFVVDQLIGLGANYSGIDQTDKESEVLARAETLARSLPYGEGLAAALCQQINTELTLGHRQRAQARFAEAQAVLARLREPQPLLVAGCLLSGAELDSANGHSADAVARSQRALDLLESTGNGRHPMVSLARSSLAGFYGELDDALKAFEYMRLAGDAEDRSGRAGTVGKLIIMANEATSLHNFGEPRRSLELLDEVVRRLQARGASPANRVFFTASYGNALSAMGRYDEALATLEQTIAAARASNNLFWQQYAQFYRGRTLLRAGRWPQARQALDEIEAAYRVDAVKNRVRLQAIALARTEWQLRTGDPATAQRTLHALLQEVGYPAAQTSWALRGALPLAAELALVQHQPARAETFALAAVNAATKAARDPAQSADVGRAMVLLARARQDAGNIGGAIQALQSAIPPLANGYGSEHAAVHEARTLLATLSSPASPAGPVSAR
jgi:eukaryotic-like serine/threonine-protein kinase